jgi:thioredoxin 1
MSINILSESSFDAVIGTKPALIDFNATWCGPCKKIAPIIEEISNENPDLFVGSVDVDMQPMLAARFQVRSIPTVLLLKDGKIVKQFIGAQAKETYQKAVAELL